MKSAEELHRELEADDLFALGREPEGGAEELPPDEADAEPEDGGAVDQEIADDEPADLGPPRAKILEAVALGPVDPDDLRKITKKAGLHDDDAHVALVTEMTEAGEIVYVGGRWKAPADPILFEGDAAYSLTLDDWTFRADSPETAARGLLLAGEHGERMLAKAIELAIEEERATEPLTLAMLDEIAAGISPAPAVESVTATLDGKPVDVKVTTPTAPPPVDVAKRDARAKQLVQEIKRLDGDIAELANDLKELKKERETEVQNLLALYRPEPDLPLFDKKDEDHTFTEDDPDAHRRCRRCRNVSPALSRSIAKGEWRDVPLCPDCLSQVVPGQVAGGTSDSSSLAETPETGSSGPEASDDAAPGDPCADCQTPVPEDEGAIIGEGEAEILVCDACAVKRGAKTQEQIEREKAGKQNPPPIARADLVFTQGKVEEAFDALCAEHGENNVLWTLSGGDFKALGYEPKKPGKIGMPVVRALAETLSGPGIGEE